MKLLPLLAVPPAVVTDTIPVIAPGITMPTSVVPLFETAIAEVPPIVNAVGVLKLVPVIVTRVPTGPDEGVNELMVGGCALTLKAKKHRVARVIINFCIKGILQVKFL